MSLSDASFHLHGSLPCWKYMCAPLTQRTWTQEELARVGLTRLALEAQGVCPDSGESFVQCLAGPCDCFLTREGLSQYIDGCRSELARQVTQRQKKAQ